MNFALELERINGRDHHKEYSPIPPDTTPAEELSAFFMVLDHEHVPYREMSPGRYAVHFEHAGQIWSVKVVTVGDLEETQEMEAVN